MNRFAIGSRRIAVALWLCASASACAAPLPAPAKTERAPAKAIATTTARVVEPVAPSPAIVAWGVRYERKCRASRGEAFLSHRGDQLTYCGDLFAADSGQYQGPAPLELTGYIFAGLDTDGGNQAWRPMLADVVDAVVSPDGARIVGVKTIAAPRESMDTTYEVSLIDSGSSTVLATAHWLGDDPPQLGFLSDGAPYIWTRQPCHTRMRALESSVTRCAPSALYRIKNNALQHGPKAFDGSTSVAVNASGNAAMIADPSGAVHLVNPIDGKVLMEAPFIALKDPKAIMAISNDGQRIAWQSPIGIEVFVRMGNAGKLVYSGPHETHAEHLRFSGDGRSLFADDPQFVEALQEGVSEKAANQDHVTVTPPQGFTLENYYEDNSLGESELRLGIWTSSRGQFALYRSDANELASDMSIEAWARKVADRYSASEEPRETSPKHSPRIALHTWKTANGRNVAFETHVDDGCNSHDRYYLMSERGEFLYRASLGVSMDHRPTKKTLQSWFEAFFERPLGIHYERAEHPDPLPKPKGVSEAERESELAAKRAKARRAQRKSLFNVR